MKASFPSPSRRRPFRLLVAGAALLFLSGCTTFKVATGEGDARVVVETSGAPLVSRQDDWSVVHTWLDEDNVLHELRIERWTEENAAAQERLIQQAFELGKMAGSGAAAP